MKKMIQWVHGRHLIFCGTSVFTSCTNSANDNPVLPQNSFSVTVKEGGEVTPKVTVSPSEAAEGQTVTLTAAKGYKFRRVEVDNAPVTFEDNGKSGNQQDEVEHALRLSPKTRPIWSPTICLASSLSRQRKPPSGLLPNRIRKMGKA